MRQPGARLARPLRRGSSRRRDRGDRRQRDARAAVHAARRRRRAVRDCRAIPRQHHRRGRHDRDGSMVCAGAIVNTGIARSAANVILNTGCTVDHHSRHRRPRAHRAGRAHGRRGSTSARARWSVSARSCCRGVRIGAWSTVGAGAVVTQGRAGAACHRRRRARTRWSASHATGQLTVNHHDHETNLPLAARRRRRRARAPARRVRLDWIAPLGPHVDAFEREFAARGRRAARGRAVERHRRAAPGAADPRRRPAATR